MKRNLRGSVRRSGKLDTDSSRLPGAGQARTGHLHSEGNSVSEGNSGRVGLGGRPPKPPTDPDVHISRIRLVISRLRCAAQQAVHHPCLGETVPLLQTLEIRPRHGSAPVAPGQPAFPDLPRLPQELLEAGEVADDPVVAVVALELLLEHLVLLRDRTVQVLPAP